jgi:hypothetical protein
MPIYTDPFVHIVYFWLHEPLNLEHQSQFEAAIHKLMQESEHIAWWHVGTPAGTPREVVDNSWTYCLHATFPTSEQHDLYQAEPAHKRFIAEAGHLWKRVQIYDSIAR